MKKKSANLYRIYVAKKLIGVVDDKFFLVREKKVFVPWNLMICNNICPSKCHTVDNILVESNDVWDEMLCNSKAILRFRFETYAYYFRPNTHKYCRSFEFKIFAILNLFFASEYLQRMHALSFSNHSGKNCNILLNNIEPNFENAILKISLYFSHHNIGKSFLWMHESGF